MASQKQITINGGSGWQTVDLGIPIQAGQHVTIFPVKKNLQGPISPSGGGTYNIPALDPELLETSTGIYVTQGTLLTITATGEWTYNGTNWVGPDGENGSLDFARVGHHRYSLIAKIGNGSWFYVGSSYSQIAPNSGYLYLAMNDAIRYDDNEGSLAVQIITGCDDSILPSYPQDMLVGHVGGGAVFAIGDYYDEPADADGILRISLNNCMEGDVLVHVNVGAPNASENNSTCENGGHVKEPEAPHPIELRTATKRLEETDIRLNTPAGELAFTRSYNQNRLTDTNYQHMGAGWSHNHVFRLSFTGTAPNRVATVDLPDGGVLKLDESGSGHFNARAGSTSQLDFNATPNEYTLLMPSRNTLVFDGTSPYNLKRRTWPNGEVWTYGYPSGKLDEVTDGYGRKLQFAYITTAGFSNGKLWRVGDQTATGLTTGSPAGRYVEFSYITEKLNGSAPGSPKALLSSIRDVRGKIWTYDWYGQDSGENESTKSNFLVGVLSPAVDTNGDGSTDGSLTLQRLTYSYKTELSVNGGMELDSDWVSIPGAVPTLNERRTTPVDTGTYSRYVQASAAGQGIQGNRWRLVAGRTYTITARVYPASGAVKMQVAGTTAFDQTSSGTGSWKTLTATYTPSNDLENCQLQFIAAGAAATFSVDTVSIIETNPNLASITQERGIQGANPALMTSAFEFKPQGLNLTREVVDGKATTHYFANGVYVGPANPAGELTAQVLGDNYRPSAQVDANSNKTQMTWNTDGKRLNAITDALNNQTSFEYNSNDTLNYTVDAQGRRTEYVYGDTTQPRLPTLIRVRETNSPTATIVQQQEFTYDSKGRVLTEKQIDPATSGVLRQITRTYHTTGNGNGLLHTVVQEDMVGSDDSTTTYTYDSAGRVIEVKQSTTFGDCCGTKTTYDDAGNVLSVTTMRDWSSPSDAVKNPITAYVYDEMGRLIRTSLNANTSAVQANLTFYDALGRVSRTITNYISQAGSPEAPGSWVWDTTQKRWEQANGTAISHGSNQDANIITDTTYNARGLVESQRDPLGNVTLYLYNPAGRLSRTIANYVEQGSSDPATWVWNTNDGRWEYGSNLAVNHGTNNDQNIITEQEYDAVGNLVKTIDALRNVHYTVYDALNRPVKTVRSAKDAATIALNPGDTGYTAANDPRSASYTPEVAPDRDLIDTTEYDSLGRVVSTKKLLDSRPAAQWAETRYLYDNQGRQNRVIVNYVAQGTTDPKNWLWNTSAFQWQDGASNTIDHGSNNFQNLITDTTYDAEGRVKTTRDTMGIKTWYTYDGLGRQTKTIVNCTYTTGATTPDMDAYKGDLNDPAEDIITQTFYDGNGRVQRVKTVLRTNAGGTDLDWRWTLYGYDPQGRQVRVIQNASSPDYPITANPPDPDLSGYTPVTDSDKDIITDTEYDSRSRVSKTTDTRGNITLHFYDRLNRRIKTIANYLVQGGSDPANWIWDSTSPKQWEDGAGTAIAFGGDKDQNRISTTSYDRAGRATATRDSGGVETRHTYDAMGRRIQTIANYDDGTFSSANPDRDLISATAYNLAGQVVSTTDVRGTQTAFTYDKTGRRLTVTQASGTGLATVSYTCYNKVGWVLRTIANWINSGTSPDAQNGGGGWVFAPTTHGTDDDQNLITRFSLDLAGRRTQMFDPLDNRTDWLHWRSGMERTMIQKQVEVNGTPADVTTIYRYDDLNRRVLAVQNYVAQGSSVPSNWVWQNNRWEDGSGNAIAHGSDNAQNIIVQVVYDKAGRQLTRRDPRGNLTSYEYDLLDRRTKLKNPLNKEWLTAYADLGSGKTTTTMTYPGITGAANYQVERTLDRLGRPSTLKYLSDSGVTPSLRYSYYGLQGVLSTLIEYSDPGLTTQIRKTQYSYDQVRHPVSIGFDTNGDDTIDEIVSYQYDAGGLRTKLTLPGNLNLTYVYDAKGQLTSLTDWDSQQTTFGYDQAGRHKSSLRANSLRSDYTHDAAGRLKRLKHTKDSQVLGFFEYTLDKRGNRTLATECLPHPATTTDTLIAHNDKGLVLTGTWTTSSPYRVTTDTNAVLKLLYMGEQVTLTLGKGSDHGICDLYLNGAFVQSFDGYAASSTTGDVVLTPSPASQGPHLLEIRNTTQKNASSSGNKVRFQQLLSPDLAYSLHTVEYVYDALARLKEARYNPAGNTGAGDADLLRRHQFTYDLAGNRLSEAVALNGGSPTTQSYTYNAANQISSGSYAYDNNGNLTSDGTNTYTWDRANRLLSMGGASYKYDGYGNRVQQTVGANVTKYLLDLQPGLPVVVAETVGANVTRFVHAPRGIHAHKDASNNWEWMVQDGLGSVRGVDSNTVTVLESRSYTPYGVPFGTTGSSQTPYGFTGEPTDSNGLSYLRARYYNPAAGVFPSLDPFEGIMSRPMSLNGYSWVEGNVPNMVDPSGLKPDIGGISEGKYEFTCRCGWIDWNHVRNSETKSYDLFDDIKYAESNFDTELKYLPIPEGYDTYHWAIRLGIQLGLVSNAIELVLFGDYAIIPNSHLNPNIRLNLAMGIFMSANERFEEKQLEFGNNWSLIPGVQEEAINSYFSEEDLPSDLIGFYVAYERNLANGGISSEEVYSRVRKLCKGVGVDQAGIAKSQKIFEETYGNGTNLVTEWKNWYARNIPLTGCSANVCSNTRTWPSEFSSLSAQSIVPNINGTWWWGSDTVYGTSGIRPAARPNVYLIPYEVPYPY